MRNKKNKSAADDLTTIRAAEAILGGRDYSYIDLLVNSNILRGERILWDIRKRRYLVMKKVTLSGSLQTQTRPEGGGGAKRQRILN